MVNEAKSANSIQDPTAGSAINNRMYNAPSHPIFPFAWSVCCHIAVAQTCLPSSPITLSANQISEQNLRNLIAEKRITYTEPQAEEEISKIRQCNSQLEIKLQGIENEIAATSLKAQELYRFKDVSSLRQRLQTLEQNLVNAEQELQKSISQIPQVGVYLVVLTDIDPFDNKNALVQKAQAALHPYAIEDLNGVNIRRLSSVSNLESVKDIIESFTSGGASDKKIFVDKQNFARKYFLYVAQVSVLPLADPNFKGQNTTFGNAVFVMKLNDTFEGELLKKNVSDEDLNTIVLMPCPI
ncbi:MAG: hypothetical protein HC892_20650 [Saprospiraceae bacterium]|nr:hypothetical protein [Saprospiraceae bacterium]